MNITMCQAVYFFQWMTVVNLALLCFYAFFFWAFKKPIVKFHAMLFGIKPAQTIRLVYWLLGLYKILWLFFNLTPYIVLLIMA